ncbi:hypothetical protein [Blastomonas fulva]|uniref:hypothetical protein n=1 Tax=Blastomonas fulva TaxID=1550728 RepID=UPI0025A44221|nr:hypothetical protein [Blastomonas fulva]MDM7927603.1 hypothetical protein [Blastomonas fulva]MDM7965298.1 hypothetical protein [Blastomonas fulva]
MTREIDPGVPRTPDEDIGVRLTDIGSFLAEATYRAVPIVWFVSALMVQFFALAFLLSLPVIGVAIVALSTVVSVMVRYWTFRRGMSRAWKIATDVSLLLNWAWLSGIALVR